VLVELNDLTAAAFGSEPDGNFGRGEILERQAGGVVEG
jgi:hypothetical protein